MEALHRCLQRERARAGICANRQVALADAIALLRIVLRPGLSVGDLSAGILTTGGASCLVTRLVRSGLVERRLPGEDDADRRVTRLYPAPGLLSLLAPAILNPES
jgi:hypothetical protein